MGTRGKFRLLQLCSNTCLQTFDNTDVGDFPRTHRRSVSRTRNRCADNNQNQITGTEILAGRRRHVVGPATRTAPCRAARSQRPDRRRSNFGRPLRKRDKFLAVRCAVFSVPGCTHARPEPGRHAGPRWTALMASIAHIAGRRPTSHARAPHDDAPFVFGNQVINGALSREYGVPDWAGPKPGPKRAPFSSGLCSLLAPGPILFFPSPGNWRERSGRRSVSPRAGKAGTAGTVTAASRPEPHNEQGQLRGCQAFRRVSPSR